MPTTAEHRARRGNLALAPRPPARYAFGTKAPDDAADDDATSYVQIDGDQRQYVGTVVDIRDGVLIFHGRSRRQINGALELGDTRTFVWPTRRLHVIRTPE